VSASVLRLRSSVRDRRKGREGIRSFVQLDTCAIRSGIERAAGIDRSREKKSIDRVSERTKERTKGKLSCWIHKSNHFTSFGASIQDGQGSLTGRRRGASPRSLGYRCERRVLLCVCTHHFPPFALLSSTPVNINSALSRSHERTERRRRRRARRPGRIMRAWRKQTGKTEKKNSPFLAPRGETGGPGSLAPSEKVEKERFSACR